MEANSPLTAAVINWMLDRTAYDDDGPGTASRELYADFATYCREQRGIREVPSEAAWGRDLTEEHECPPRHTRGGKRRPLRLRQSGEAS